MYRKYPTKDKKIAKKSLNKKVRGATEIVTDGIKFKSKLEAFCYKTLKANNIPFEYEKVKFILFTGYSPSFNCFFPNKLGNMTLDTTKVRDITYTPDFTGDNWILETKGRANDVYPVKLKIFRKFMEGNKKYIAFLEPHNQKQVLQSIEIIKQLNNK